MTSNSIPSPRRVSWFRPELRNKDYGTLGDAYDDENYQKLTENWNVDATERDSTEQRYLTFVKQASNDKWIHLRLLADFMQIGSIPRDWKPPFRPNDAQGRLEQKKRWGRTNICVLEYPQTKGPVRERRITATQGGYLNTEDLRRELHRDVSEDASFRLYVVEDLSRNVVEALGSEFGIDPDFFRAHIVDYSWYNVRDRWREAQPLERLRGRRSWFQLRYVTTRYFERRDQFEEAERETKDFNILRRLDDDKSKGWWDSKEAVVALMRARATFWLKPKGPRDETAIGVLLLDPNVSEGLPLWRGHRNFHPVPFAKPPDQWPAWDTLSHTSPEDRRRHYFFEDFIYWAQQAEALGAGPDEYEEGHAEHQQHHHLLPLQALLHLVGAEWLTMCDYIKTRLSQVDLEAVDPAHFAFETRSVEAALGKLHLWRHLIPLYREMVAETLQHVFRAPCRAQAGYLSAGGAGGGGAGPGAGAGARGGGGAGGRDAPTSPPPPPLLPPSIGAYREDFALVHDYLEECQARVDRLTSVVTAVMAVEDTRRASNDARNMGRLTWLATFFIPFSVVAGIFTIEHAPDDAVLRRYFEVTLPTIALTLAAGWAIHSPWVRAHLRRYWEQSTGFFSHGAAVHGMEPRGR